MADWLEHASWGRILVLGIAGAVLFELFTVLLRFGLHLQSAQQTSWLAQFTFGVRVHHGFVGLFCLVLAAALGNRALPCHALVIVGIALALSDALHHFVVLPLAIGATEFDLLYPNR